MNNLKLAAGLEFEWPVASQGYEVVEGRPLYRAALVDGRVVSGPPNAYIRAKKRSRAVTRLSNPLRNRTLHRDFADLGVGDFESQALAFANEHGLLRQPVREPPEAAEAEGESLAEWRTEVGEMAALLALWELIREGDSVQLRNLAWTGAGQWNGPEALAGPQRDLARLSARDDRLLPTDLARRYLSGSLNLHMGGITPRLAAEGNEFGVDFVPETLGDALWLSFMLEVRGDIRVCCYCGELLDPIDREPGMRAPRRDKLYHANCRRMKCHYRKKEREVAQ